MSVPIKPEPKNMHSHVQERCAICRAPTRTWTALRTRKAGDQVALCSVCAAHAKPEDIPTKVTWCRREEIAARSDEADA